MIGKRFRYTHNKKITWDVEIIAESLTHYYVLKLGTHRRWNEPKRRFLNWYTEI
jgi:hypothetical protein